MKLLTIILSLTVLAAAAHADQNMYGWLSAVNYDDRGAPQYPYTRVSLAVFGVTTTRSTGIPCNRLYLNSSLPQIDGISVGDFGGKSVGEINQSFAPHRGRFVRLNDVEIHSQRNQTICVASSVAVVEDFAKANVTFSEVGGHFMARVVDAAIRADDLMPPNVAPDSIDRPDEYECKFYRWASSEAARAWYDEFRQSGNPRPDSFRMEFIGVRPINEIEYCEFDTMNTVSHEAEVTAGSQSNQSSDTERSTGDTLQADRAEDEEVLDPKAMGEECGRLGSRMCQRVCFQANSVQTSSAIEACRAAYNRVRAEN